MQTQLILNIDSQTIELANFYAKEKGLTVNEMLEFYLKTVVWNETLKRPPSILDNNLIVENVQKTVDKWSDLECFLSSNRFNLPSNYKFDRDGLYDR